MDFSSFQPISFTDLPARLDLNQQTVHIWCAPLDLGAERLHQLSQMLAADEQARANRFRFETDRHRFMAGRGLLRFLLARYLQTSPEQLVFTYSPQGKPALADPGWAGISFNVSHSGGLALYAMTCDRQVGIDIEQIRSISDLEQLAQRYFLPNEYALIQAFPPAQRQQIFFRLWTCKEAYLKATGEGITGLKRVEVALEPDDSPKNSIVKLRLNSAPAADWTVIQLDIDPEYAAALAVEGRDLQLMQYGLVPDTRT